MMRGRLFVASWIGLFALITLRSITRGDGLPLAANYVAGSVIWTGLGLLSEGSPELAGALGLGILTALLLANSDILGKVHPPSSQLSVKDKIKDTAPAPSPVTTSSITTAADKSAKGF